AGLRARIRLRERVQHGLSSRGRLLSTRLSAREARGVIEALRAARAALRRAAAREVGDRFAGDAALQVTSEGAAEPGEGVAGARPRLGDEAELAGLALEGEAGDAALGVAVEGRVGEAGGARRAFVFGE